jgi:hypothetical protein
MLSSICKMVAGGAGPSLPRASNKAWECFIVLRVIGGNLDTADYRVELAAADLDVD